MNFLSDNENLVKKASYLRIIARDLAEEMKAGNFRSLYKGQGMEFSGVRDYIPGDDIRTLDWNVTARMNRPYVKIYEEERELQIFLILDVSSSMFLETGNKRTKYESASEAAALISIAAELNNCPVGAVFFDGEVFFSCKPELGRERTMLLLTRLDRLSENHSEGSALSNALNGAGSLLKKRSLVFVISDFKTDDYEKPLISLAQKNDVIALRVHDTFDDELPSIGTVLFEDAESHKKMMLPSSSQSLKKEWRSYSKALETRWNDCCVKHGILPVIMDTKKEPFHVLNGIFGAKR